jgi:hypothetical protein
MGAASHPKIMSATEASEADDYGSDSPGVAAHNSPSASHINHRDVGSELFDPSSTTIEAATADSASKRQLQRNWGDAIVDVLQIPSISMRPAWRFSS